MAHWLYKSEPFKWSWDSQVAAGAKGTHWDGVRNHAAKLNLMAMKLGDRGFFYHSNEGKEIVGVARIARAAYPDPSAPGEDWSAVDVEPAYSLQKTVGLDAIKNAPELAALQMLTRNRLSVTRVTAPEWSFLHGLAATRADTQAPRTKKAAR